MNDIRFSIFIQIWILIYSVLNIIWLQIWIYLVWIYQPLRMQIQIQILLSLKIFLNTITKIIRYSMSSKLFLIWIYLVSPIRIYLVSPIWTYLKTKLFANLCLFQVVTDAMVVLFYFPDRSSLRHGGHQHDPAMPVFEIFIQQIYDLFFIAHWVFVSIIYI